MFTLALLWDMLVSEQSIAKLQPCICSNVDRSFANAFDHSLVEHRGLAVAITSFVAFCEHNKSRKGSDGHMLFSVKVWSKLAARLP